MDLDRFLLKRQGAWRKLASMLQFADRSGLELMNVQQLRELGALYRAACSDLIYARTVLQNGELGDYLNQLVGEAYASIYRRSWLTPRLAWDWFRFGLPSSVRRNFMAVLVSWALLLGGIGGGFGATMADREAFLYFVPTQYQGLYGKRQDDLRKQRFGDQMTTRQSREFSAQLFTHNIQVSFAVFVMGASYGVLSVVMITYNGLLLGSIAANFHRWGQDLDFWALIVPHGGMEMSCIVLAGAAGLMLGWSLIRPGRRTRGEAFAEASREAVPLALGVVPFLVVAGIIEAFVAPSGSVSPWAKIILGIVTGAALWIHLLLPRRKRA